MLLKELHISLSSPPTLWCDNSGALALASNPVFHARTKHIEVDVHFVREKVANRDIQLHYLSTLDQVADIFTKGHTADQFCFLRAKLKVVPPFSLQGGVKHKSDHESDLQGNKQQGHEGHEDPSILSTFHANFPPKQELTSAPTKAEFSAENGSISSHKSWCMQHNSPTPRSVGSKISDGLPLTSAWSSP